MQAGPRRVGHNGKICVRHVAIQLGYEHRDSTVTVVLTRDNVAIFDRHGHHIRSLNLEPGHTYYSNGRPRGWNNNTRVSRLTCDINNVRTNPRHDTPRNHEIAPLDARAVFVRPRLG